MKLLAIIMAFGLFHYFEKPIALKSFTWLSDLRLWIEKWIANPYIQISCSVVLPVMLLYFLLTQVFDFSSNSLGYLLTHVMVLYYCLGPQTLAKMIRQDASKQLLPESTVVTPEKIVNQLTDAALHRWFGVFFWYVVLNVYGALLYRVMCHLAQTEGNHQVKSALMSLMKLVEFPVTILMTVSLALASDFDRIWQHCKQYITVETLKNLNSQYMYKSMDFAVEQCEIEKNDENNSQIIQLTTYKVLKRMLVVWLVFSALMVIFSIG